MSTDIRIKPYCSQRPKIWDGRIENRAKTRPPVHKMGRRPQLHIDTLTSLGMTEAAKGSIHTWTRSRVWAIGGGEGDGSGVGGTIEGVGNKRVAGTTGSRASANGDDWGEVESVGTWV